MTSAEFRREKMAPREEHECTAMKDEIQELKDQNKKTKAELLAQMELEKQELKDRNEKMKDQNEKTKADLLAQMKLETQKLNDQNKKTKTELVAQIGTLEGEVHELKNLLRQLVDK